MKRRGALRPATFDQLSSLWPAVRSSNVFDTPDELERFWGRAPWRVLVTSAGEAALIDRWRAHLDVCAMRALWCDSRRVPDCVADIRAIAEEQELSSLLSPLVPPEAAAPYERAGMHPYEHIITLRRNIAPSDAEDGSLPLGPGVSLRPGGLDDVHGVLDVDRQSFDEFWRYDPQLLGAYLGTERLTVAEEDGIVVGYTLCTLKAEVGTVGRLAVSPSARRHGTGTALLEESVRWMARRGARGVTLCTQQHNTASRALYRRSGFRELPGKLVFLISGPWKDAI